MSDMENIIPIRAAFDAYNDWSGAYIKGGDYGVTQLLDPPRLVHLRLRHEHELPPEPVKDKWKAFQGNAWHAFFEKNIRKANNMPEYKDRFIVEGKVWDKIFGVKLAGKIDVYDTVDKCLYDYKVTGAYKLKMQDYADWERQLNVYAWFLNQCKFEVKHIAIIAVVPEWNHWESEKDRLYPDEVFTLVPLNIWSHDEQEVYVHTKVKQLLETAELEDNDLPLCSDEDRWIKPATFALMEPGKKRATRVLGSREEMEKYINYRAEQGKPILSNFTIDERKSSPTRCMDYCRVNGFCKQHQAYLAEMDDAERDE